MDGTILCQGSFLANVVGLANPTPGSASRANANPTILNIPSNVDWLKVSNFTQYGTVGAAGSAYFNGTANATVGYEFWWQRGMPAGSGLVSYKAAATAARSDDIFGLAGTPVTYSGGFTLYDPSGQEVGALPLLGNPVAVTGISSAANPVVSTASTAGLAVGSVVRLSNSSQTDTQGLDFVVGAVTLNTSFTILTSTNPFPAPFPAAGGAGFYRIVNYNPLYYPRRRYVVNISQAVNAQVSTSIAHGLTPGQEVRFHVPSVAGMTQLNSTQENNFLAATVLTVVDDYNFTIDQDTTSYTAFSWPTVTQQPSNFPEVVPVGENTAVSLITPLNQVPTIAGQRIFGTQSALLADATTNTGFLGMILGSGGTGLELTTPILGPSGSVTWSMANVATPDRLYWVAGKSSFGGL